MQIYANHIQIHTKIASCVPPHCWKEFLWLYTTPSGYVSLPISLLRKTHTWKEGGVRTWGRARGGVRTSAVGGGRVPERLVRTGSDMCGWSKRNVNIPGSAPHSSQAAHSISSI